MIFTFHLIRIQSNIEYAFNNDGELMISTSEGFKSILKNENNIKFNEVFKNGNVTIQSINIKRKNESLIHKIENFVNPNRITVFEFNLENDFGLIADIKNELNPINTDEAMSLANSNFAINTNFFGSGAIGEVIIDKKRYGQDNKTASGFFKVIDGKPFAGARSLFKNNAGIVSYSCQAFPSVMKNGDFFPYIISEKPPYRPSWKNKTYRNLIGNLPNGNLVFVLSNNGALLSVKEIALIGKKYGITNASLFDGGAALQYEYNSKNFKMNFSAFNNNINFGEIIDKKFMTLAKSHFPTKSPVFLVVKHFTAKPEQH